MWLNCYTFRRRAWPKRGTYAAIELRCWQVAKQQRLFLIDAFGFIFRAYHARARSNAPPMRTSTGFSTEAVYIFNNMLRKLSKQHDPPYIAAIFESGEATHRVRVRGVQGQSERDPSRPAGSDSLCPPRPGGDAHPNF